MTSKEINQNQQLQDSSIDREIISVEYGIGRIIRVFKLHDGLDDFFEVEFSQTNVKNYYPVNSMKKYRFLSTKDRLLEAVDVFKTKHVETEFKSTHEYINHYKKLFEVKDLAHTAKTLSLLKGKEALNPQLKVLFDRALKSFVLELKYVLNLTKTQASDLLKI